MMFLVEYIGAPPTMGFSAANRVATTLAATRATIVRFFLFILVFVFTRSAQRPVVRQSLFIALQDQVCLVIRRINGFGCRDFLARVSDDSSREFPLCD